MYKMRPVERVSKQCEILALSDKLRERKADVILLTT